MTNKHQKVTSGQVWVAVEKKERKHMLNSEVACIMALVEEIFRRMNPKQRRKALLRLWVAFSVHKWDDR